MPGIPNETIQTILDKADIESVVGSYVQFTKRSGNNLFGLCPFHSENTPSFSVNIERGFYHCFGCHKSGNSIGFIMEMEKLTFVEAVRFLGDKYGVEIKEDSSYRNDGENKKKERVRKLLSEAGKYYYSELIGSRGKAAVEYCSKRAMKPSCMKAFGIGYAPAGWDNLYNYLKNKGFTDEEMSVSGLFTVSRKTGKLIDLFRDRLIFPIFDVFGNVIAYGGRVLDGSLPKYINSPDSLVYKKQEHLYALNFAKKDRSGKLIVVEGYMDAFAMHQAGVINAVASLGTAFTDSQLRLASRYANEIVFFFDSDNAGQNAAIRAIQKMLSYMKKMSSINLRIRIAKVPDGKDPDEFIRNNGVEAFNHVINDSKDVETYLSERAYDDNYNDGDEEGNPGLDLYNYQRDIIEYASWINDEIIRSRMASNAAVLLNAKSDILLGKINDAYENREKQAETTDKKKSSLDTQKEVRERTENIQTESSVKNDYSDATSEAELQLFVLAVALGPNLADKDFIDIEDVIRIRDFRSKPLQSIVGEFLSLFDAKTGVSEAYVINMLGAYTFNSKPAESEYIRIVNRIERTKDYRTLRGLYLGLLYKLRMYNLKSIKQRLIENIDSATENEREDINNKLRKIDRGIEYIKSRSARIE